MNSFSIILNCKPVSNIKGNKICSYYTVFDKCFDLIGEWECGLKDISFTLPREEEEPKLFLITAEKTIEIPNSKINLKTQIDNIIKEINHKTKLYCELVNLLEKHNTKERIVIPQLIKKDDNLLIHNGYLDKAMEMVFLLPSKSLCHLLGFDYEFIIKYSENVFKKYQKSLTRKENYNFINENRDISNTTKFQQGKCENSFYICSDICKHLIHGEVKKPILRHVNFDQTKELSNNTFTYKNPHFIRVRSNHMSYIRIEIYDYLQQYTSQLISDDHHDKSYLKFDELSKFKNGEIKITLLFRKLSEKPIKYEYPIEKKFTILDDFDIVKFNAEKFSNMNLFPDEI